MKAISNDFNRLSAFPVRGSARALAISRLDDDEKDGVGITDAITAKGRTIIPTLFVVLLAGRRPRSTKTVAGDTT